MITLRCLAEIPLPMSWTITFYNEKVEEDALALPPGILASLLRITELIEEFGPDLGRPQTAPLGRGLFEMRARGPEGIARAMFCSMPNQEVVILMTAIKKSNKLPKRLLETAQKRMKEVRTYE